MCLYNKEDEAEKERNTLVIMVNKVYEVMLPLSLLYCVCVCVCVPG
jgi:hypothetical protein